MSRKGAKKNSVSMKKSENDLRHLGNVLVRRENNDHFFVNVDNQQVKRVDE